MSILTTTVLAGRGQNSCHMCHAQTLLVYERELVSTENTFGTNEMDLHLLP